MSDRQNRSFAAGGGIIEFFARAPAAGVLMHGPHGPLAKRDDACRYDNAGGEFVWAFALTDALHDTDRYVFECAEYRCMGEVADGGAIITIGSAAPAGHNAAFGGRPPALPARPIGPPRPAARAAAADLGAISIRHAAGSSAGPYSTYLHYLAGVYYVGTRMSDLFGELRGANEIDEVYCRPAGTDAWKPLEGGDLATVGEIAIVPRVRDPFGAPRIAGIMLAKDEADAIPEVIAALVPALDELFFSAGDAATEAAIAAAAPAGWAHSVPVSGPAGDGARAVLHAAARAAAIGDPRPLWIMPVQGDEIYADDLRAHVCRAQAERATVMTAQVATFVLHESQRAGADWGAPLDRRLTHYVWDFGEHAGFLDFPWVHYNPTEHMRAFPHGLFPARYASARPVRKHYPFRSPDQAAARIADRLASGWQPHYANYQGIFMDKMAAGRPIKRYHGWFPEAEHVEGIW